MSLYITASSGLCSQPTAEYHNLQYTHTHTNTYRGASTSICVSMCAACTKVSTQVPVCTGCYYFVVCCRDEAVTMQELENLMVFPPLPSTPLHPTILSVPPRNLSLQKRVMPVGQRSGGLLGWTGKPSVLKGREHKPSIQSPER